MNKEFFRLTAPQHSKCEAAHESRILLLANGVNKGLNKGMQCTLLVFASSPNCEAAQGHGVINDTCQNKALLLAISIPDMLDYTKPFKNKYTA